MKNREINALIARVEAGESLGQEEALDVLRQFLRANRTLIKARNEGFVPKRKKGKAEEEQGEG